MNKLNELKEELRTVFAGRGNDLLDSLLPLVVFLVLNALIGFRSALLGAFIIAVSFLVHRAVKRERLLSILAGFGGVLIAAGFVTLSGSEAAFFLPGFVSGSITIVLCVGSVLAGRPLAGWASYLTRRWPLDWYWLPLIKPAYRDVTLIWAGAFSARLGLEYWLYQSQAVNALGFTKIVLGWPFTILILILSYLYGIWRLGKLGGPSVEEHQSGIDPPWEGQNRGF
jgi:hypothetical protein